MGLNDTPRADRLHIAIFGSRNAGKSSLINALTGQQLAIVSDTPGTTTDPVLKSMELHPIGPVVFIDTAGFDDEGELGQLRVNKTESIIPRSDVAILVLDGTRAISDNEKEWAERLRSSAVPVITVINKWDILEHKEREAALTAAGKLSGIDNDSIPAIPVSVITGYGIYELRDAIEKSVPDSFMQRKLLGGLAKEGDTVLLVMPQDIQAPKGRLILPQVQTIRELLDMKCQVMSTTADGLVNALDSLKHEPDLIITDSQCFADVYALKPHGSKLTSFSILMAASKGDIEVFTEGASVIDKMMDASNDHHYNILIAEACTHVPLREDIGTVKIPRVLKKALGDRVEITNVRGSDFPDLDGLKKFDLVIHCGACMFNRRHVMSRIAEAQAAGVPITNYGIFLAKMTGILDKVSLP